MDEWTKGIKLDSKNYECNAKLYSNRALLHHSKSIFLLTFINNF